MAFTQFVEWKAEVNDQASASPECGGASGVSENVQNRFRAAPWWRLWVLAVSGGIVAIIVGCQQRESTPPKQATGARGTQQPGTAVPQYSVVAVEDVSFANVVRKSYRVRVHREMTKEELSAIAEAIIREATAKEKINAISAFFYLPDSDTNGTFTAGKVTWAPAGDWSEAGSNLPPKLAVKVGGALGTVSKESVVDLPLEKKKHIFMQISRYQDRGILGDEAYAAVAREFGVTVEQARKIGVEGIMKGWPIP